MRSARWKVFDGVPLIARVIGGKVAIDGDRGAGACFLVYADVASWRWTMMGSSLVGGDVESHVLRLAARQGLQNDAPLAFLLRGVTATLVFHVLDERDGLLHSPARHERAKVRFTLRDREVEVIGFHSTEHRGIFTRGESNVHLPFEPRSPRAIGEEDVDGSILQCGSRGGRPRERGGRRMMLMRHPLLIQRGAPSTPDTRGLVCHWPRQGSRRGRSERGSRR